MNSTLLFNVTLTQDDFTYQEKSTSAYKWNNIPQLKKGVFKKLIM